MTGNIQFSSKSQSKMTSTLPNQSQLHMFEMVLSQMINPRQELAVLAERFDWPSLEKELTPLFSKTGRPGHPIRRIVSFLILKQLYNISDERLVIAWTENIYWQHFTGERLLQHICPINASELCHFRKRLGVEGVEKIFRFSILLHGKKALEKECVCDTTVQEKNITFPTDVKFQRRIIKRCVKHAKEAEIKLRRSYRREAKECLLALRFRDHPQRRKEANKAARRLKTIALCMCRDLKRKLVAAGKLLDFEKKIELYFRVLSQKREDKDKIYSLHEPTVSCIAKGKEHKKYEFGCKVSILTTKSKGIIIGVGNFTGNPHDSKTLEPTLDQVKRLIAFEPDAVIVDRGYRGLKKIGNTQILLPDSGTGKTEYEKRKSRNRFRRRAGIEPRISHLKYDHRMARNYLSGVLGDAVNLMMAATAWNLRKFLGLPGTSCSFFTWLWNCAKEYAVIDPFRTTNFSQVEF